MLSSLRSFTVGIASASWGKAVQYHPFWSPAPWISPYQPGTGVILPLHFRQYRMSPRMNNIVHFLRSVSLRIPPGRREYFSKDSFVLKLNNGAHHLPDRPLQSYPRDQRFKFHGVVS
ncbi:hypothetical protein BDN72DRAFT_391168 [Pluteus cervinus]|uniref:Uncharacterized protein n=1 Tax=Pluteus cervinus TaxID=181527 RepID=A0ACD3AA03_9AGAR|nr:hypothetical protein BDN72DRAFT_391168 [Pluteus cervinus]